MVKRVLRDKDRVKPEKVSNVLKRYNRRRERREGKERLLRYCREV